MTFLIDYTFRGDRYGCELDADSFEDAEARLQAIKFGEVRVVGQKVLSVRLPGGSWIAHLLGRTRP